MRARAKQEIAMGVDAATIRLGDVVFVGGRPLRVVDLTSLPGGARRIEFDGGAVLSVGPGAPLTVFRVAEGW